MTTFVPFADLHETHTGIVVLVGDRAYKLKKPVNPGFLDFRLLSGREAVCHREVELNRRLAPDVYLGVAHISGVDVGQGEPVVVMRRMPDELRLSTLVRSGTALDDVIRQLARIAAAFHSKAGRGPQIDAQGRRDAVRSRWHNSFRQVRSFRGTVLDEAVAQEIESLADEFLAGRDPLFDRRVADGRIVDGHGDLLCDDIFCLDDGPRVLDCLEFDDLLRYLDGMDDIAFLAMDLEYLGATRESAALLNHYAEFAGDPAPPALRHHYVAYRAFVRAKVSCLRHAQGDPTAAADSSVYADLSVRHLRSGDVRLILVGGLPGAGKSTVAGQLADRLGAVLLSTDRIRKESAGISPSTRATTTYGHGLYDKVHTAVAYTELLHRAEELLGFGETVILDASWTDGRFRDQAVEVSARAHARLVPVECCAPPEERQARLAARVTGPSDADSGIADRMAADADPWPEAMKLPTTGTADHAADDVLQSLHVTDGAARPQPADRRSADRRSADRR